MHAEGDLALSTADHPETDEQTERVNRVVEDILRSIAVDHPRDWSRWLPYAEFAINSSEHASTAVTPFYFNSLRHPRVPATLFEGIERSAAGGQLDASARSPSPDVAPTTHVDARDTPHVRSRFESVTVLPDSTQNVGKSGAVLSYGTRAQNSQSQTGSGDRLCTRQPQKRERAVPHTCAEIELCSTRCESEDEAVATARQFVNERTALLRRVRDQLAAAQDKQKHYADKSGRKNKQTFCVGDKVLLSIKNLSNDAVTTPPSGSKLLPQFIGLALPDHTKTFSVVCDASDFAIGCALVQKDDGGHERVASYQSRLLEAAEKNYPVNDKELLAIKYALLKFRVRLLGETPFIVYTDHASLRIAINSSHLSQQMARWLAFFSEFNFRVECKPGKENALADALSRRPDYESSVDNSSDALCLERTPDLMHLSISRVQTKLKDNIQSLYSKDDECRLLIARFDGSLKESLPAKLESKLARFSYHDGLWHRLSNFDYSRVYVPHDQDLKLSILHEFHDAPASDHLGREKTFFASV
uniref:Reverse transcriptase RNase H-like domain-containing protein n=1 Tax=Globisporangium ultimum (strain ATCC 200006 / CBS 805.95 / DAOM BR144) TaxID=431595 RepID=K3XCB4_GLOUD